MDTDIPAVFTGLFAATSAPLDPDDPSKVVLFGLQGGADVDLVACCQSYGQTRGRNRVLAAPQTIFLYAVLLRRPCRQTRRNAVSSNYTGDIGSGDLPGVAARSSATETI